MCLKSLTYFLRMPKKVRSFDPSLWPSSGVATAGGDGGDDDMVGSKTAKARASGRIAAEKDGLGLIDMRRLCLVSGRRQKLQAVKRETVEPGEARCRNVD
jgi:hypothetical protein